MSFWDKKEAKRLFQELSFYRALIGKLNIIPLNNINLLHKVSFYNELGIVKTSKAFKNMQEVITLK